MTLWFEDSDSDFFSDCNISSCCYVWRSGFLVIKGDGIAFFIFLKVANRGPKQDRSSHLFKNIYL
ncbi:hypothetical protein D0S45_08875 [Marinifilum sp. JC120]|nr:hypothetical protein D0S45_08875 [Marinifilum sp. JC120]